MSYIFGPEKSTTEFSSRKSRMPKSRTLVNSFQDVLKFKKAKKMVHNIIFSKIQCNLLCSKVYIGFIHKILDMRMHHFIKINFTFLSFSIIIKWDISKLSLNMRGNTICPRLYIILLPYMCFKVKKRHFPSSRKMIEPFRF